jgi:hypothetical protein
MEIDEGIHDLQYNTIDQKRNVLSQRDSNIQRRKTRNIFDPALNKPNNVASENGETKLPEIRKSQ